MIPQYTFTADFNGKSYKFSMPLGKPQKVMQDYLQNKSLGVRELARKYNNKELTIRANLSDASSILELVKTCKKCGKEYIQSTGRIFTVGSFDDKQQAIDKISDYLCRQENGLCKFCIQSEKYDKENKFNVSQAKKGFENGNYESLNKLEMRVLIELSKYNGGNPYDSIRKKYGLSEENIRRIVNKFIDVHILYQHTSSEDGEEWETGYLILPELVESLSDVICESGVNPIFPNDKVMSVYKRLKQEHLFVYPEVPICVFINKDFVKDVFTQDWHEHYYLTARVDFLVCDEDSNPKFAVEYQGSYHKDNNAQIGMDEFKRKILEYAGLPIEYTDFVGEMRRLNDKNIDEVPVPGNVKPGSLVAYLKRLHECKGLKLSLDDRAYLRPAKELIFEFGPDEALRATKESALYAHHSWSFKYVREFCKPLITIPDDDIEEDF